jgi:hypothetical protein
VRPRLGPLPYIYGQTGLRLLATGKAPARWLGLRQGLEELEGGCGSPCIVVVSDAFGPGSVKPRLTRLAFTISLVKENHTGYKDFLSRIDVLYHGVGTVFGGYSNLYSLCSA